MVSLNNAAVFPWANSRLLAESLNSGEICLATAMSQFAAISRESLRVMEDYASEQSKAHLERKNKLEKLEKLVNDLSEKCQAMQQALLYKEEKYDEKCREVERYKVICEMSAKAAINDDIYYKSEDMNNNINHNSNDINNNNDDNLFDFADYETVREPDKLTQQAASNRGAGIENQSDANKIASSNTKIAQSKLNQGNQGYLSDYVNGPTTISEESASNQPREANYNEEFNRSLDKPASYYVGGPVKRKSTSSVATSKVRQNVKLRDRLSLLGAVNVGFDRINPSRSINSMSKTPTTISSSSSRFANSFRDSENQNKRMKISLTGQSNEVMSSSRNAMNQLKQKFTERDLHRQVAAAAWTRLANRRKKEWPF